GSVLCLLSAHGAGGSEPAHLVLRHAVSDHVAGHTEQPRRLDLVSPGHAECVLDQHAFYPLIRVPRERTEKVAERLAERRGRIGAAEGGAVGGRGPECDVPDSYAVAPRLESRVGVGVLGLANVAR